MVPHRHSPPTYLDAALDLRFFVHGCTSISSAKTPLVAPRCKQLEQKSERSLKCDTSNPMEVADMHRSELSWHAPRTSILEDGDLNAVLQR